MLLLESVLPSAVFRNLAFNKVKLLENKRLGEMCVHFILLNTYLHVFVFLYWDLCLHMYVFAHTEMAGWHFILKNVPTPQLQVTERGRVLVTVHAGIVSFITSIGSVSRLLLISGVGKRRKDGKEWQLAEISTVGSACIDLIICDLWHTVRHVGWELWTRKFLQVNKRSQLSF